MTDPSGSRGLYGFDVLQLTPVMGKEQDLEGLANSWGADSVQWIGLPEARMVPSWWAIGW